jgi:hypothetical protein
MDWLIFGAVMIAVMVLMFLFLSRRIHRQYNAKEFLDEVQREVNVMVTELNQTTERNIQLIEDRMQKLNVLMKEADRRILLANQELTKKEISTYEHLAAKRARTQPASAPDAATLFDNQPDIQTSPVNETRTVVYQQEHTTGFHERERTGQAHLAPQSPANLQSLAGQRIRSPRIADLVAKNADYVNDEADAASPSWRPDEAITPGAKQNAKPLSREAMKAQIVEMSAAGIASAVISQRFNITAGEVELILSLSRGART